MEHKLNIQDLEVTQLQALVTKYPWFSYAREQLLYKLVEMEPQCLESRYKESLVFFPMRERVVLKARGIAASKSCRTGVDAVLELMGGEEVEPLEELCLNIDIPEADIEVAADEELLFDVVLEKDAEDEMIDVQPEKPKIVVVGGDYFSKEDFAQLDESEKVAEIKFGAPADNLDREAQKEEDAGRIDFDSLDFVTETLAKIYADQGYYDKAIEVYAKLILLYPEKSAYFAALVNEIKSKN